jgi:uncharacterized protein (TIGR03437 family)
MPIRIILLLFLAISSGISQNLLTDYSFSGTGIDSARGVAVDSSGNIYVVGSTASFDFPVLNAFQNANSGTQVIYSTDAGATWKPLASPFPIATVFQPLIGAVDPKNSSTLYVASGPTVCKSTDAGHNFHCVTLSVSSSQASINSLAIDPQQPATIYATGSVPGAVFKSIDGGQTWANAGNGLPSSAFLGPIAIDPFHPNILYVWVGIGGYVSQDGAASWTPSSLPWPSNVTTGGAFSFDPVTPGVIYGSGFMKSALTIQKSIDGGQTWTQLNTPFSSCCVVPDPKVSGRLYDLVFVNNGTPDVALWRSQDGGLTWTSSSVPRGATGPLVVDPSNPQIFLAGGYRSADGGQTWSPTNVSRSITPQFASTATDLVYAIAPITSDAFIAKFLPDGQTLVFATYFGGMGNDSANSIALDPTGNIWIAGTTSSYDLPVPPGAFQSTLKGITNGFVAKFTNDGKLLAASYLGGSNQDSALGIAIGPNGNSWLIGSWSSLDFPFTVAAPASFSFATTGVLSELDSAAAQLLYSAPVDGVFDRNGKGIAIDPSGNITVTGATYDPKFPVTSGAFHSGVPSQANPKAFVSKLDPSGKPIYSTYFGGSQLPPPPQGSFPGFLELEPEQDLGVAVANDSAGNAYVAGNTGAIDFPVTNGAYQTSIASNCPYAAFSFGTGLIGTFYSYFIDDSFVVKLSPDGQTVLYSTLLGGSCYDRPASIAVDASGNAYIAGETDSADYPLVSAVEGAPAVRQFASFISALNPAGSALTFSTYLHAGSAPSVAAGSNGSIYVTGSIGFGAQSIPDTGFPNPPPTIVTDAYLATIHISASAPPVNLVQVANAFSLIPGPIAPGEIVTLKVPGFNPAQPADVGLNVLAPLTTNLQGVQVSFDGRPVFVMRVSYGQIECIAPAAIAGQRTTRVQVSIDGGLSNVLNVSVAPTAIGLLSADGLGTGLANARNSDGTSNSESNPAPRGSVVTVFLTGAGITNPPEPDGAVPASTEIVPAASILTFFPGPSTGGIHALPGFVPGLFAYAFSVPVITQQPPGSTIGIMLRTDSSTSQNLFIYVR